MADFGNCINWVLRLEDRTLRGISKNLGDGAGWTRLGITSKNNPQVPAEFFTTMPIDQALETAKNVYWQKYWLPIQGSLLPTDELAATLLSFDVNDGSEAVKLLQGCLGLTSDGSFGPVTLQAVLRANPADLVQELREAQERFYRGLAARNSNDARFLDGWVKRARVIYPALP
jgi:lysozyme family protein